MNSKKRIFIVTLLAAAGIALLWGALGRRPQPITPENVGEVVELERFGRGWIRDVALSPDEQTLLLTSATGIWLYDLGTQGILRYINASSVNAGSVAWSPDGDQFATGSSDGVIRIWDTASGVVTLKFDGPSSGVGIIAWSPDGTKLASGSYSDGVHIWQAKDGQLYQNIGGDSRPPVQELIWSPDGTMVAEVSDRSNEIHIWEVESGQLIYSFDQAINTIANSISWSPDGTRLATVHGDEFIGVWDISLGRALWKTTGGGSDELSLFSVAWSPDGKQLAAQGLFNGRDGVVNIYTVADGVSLTQVMEGSVGFSRGLIWRQEGKSLLTLDFGSELYLWDIKSGEKQRILSEHFDAIESIAWSPNDRLIATAGWSGRVRIFDVERNSEVQSFMSDTLSSLAWMPDGERLISYTVGTGVARVWEAESGNLLMDVDLTSSAQDSLSPDGKLLFRNELPTIRVFDAENNNLLVLLEAHAYMPGVPSWSPDEKKIAFWGHAYPEIGVKLLTIKGQMDQVDREFSLPYHLENGTVAWSPDSKYLAIGFAGKIEIWDVDSNKLVRVIEVGNGSIISAISWSSDGTRLVTGGSDGIIRIWGIP